MHRHNGYKIPASAALDFIYDDALTLGASLGFYTAVSLAPLLLILLAATALLGPDVQTQIVQEVENSMGRPADAVVVILLWIYYASLIFFYGAELTQTRAAFHGRRLQPQEYAEETPEGQQKRQRQLQEVGR